MPKLIPPTNVRLQHGDWIIPLECVYIGMEDGNHVWRATAPVARWQIAHAHLLIEILPAHTAVRIEFRDDG